MRRALIVVLASLVVSACDGGGPKHTGPTAEEILNAPDGAPKPPAPGDAAFLASLDLLCRLSTEALANEVPDSDKASGIAEAFRASNPDPEFLRVMQSLAGTVPGARAGVLRREAARHGRKGWTCPALEEP